MSKIIFFNGPPGSGKDTIGNQVAMALCSIHPYANIMTEKFAKPLKGMAKGMFGWSDDEADYYMETQEGKATIVPHTEHIFEVRGARYVGPEGECEPNIVQIYTYRQLLIDFSEKFVKPLFGEDAFGKLLLDRINGSEADFVIITDCGFSAELQPVIEHVGGENCLIVQVYRDGFDFKKDSRSYISNDQCSLLALDNNGTIKDSVQQVLDMLETMGEMDKELHEEYYEQQRKDLELLSSAWQTPVEN